MFARPVSCRRVEVNFEAVSAHTVEIFNGMTMSSKKDLDDGLGGFGYEGEDGSDAILTVSFRRRTLIAAISTVQPDRSCALFCLRRSFFGAVTSVTSVLFKK